MKKLTRKFMLSGILSVLVISGLLVAVKSLAAGGRESANGQGSLENTDGSKRQFAFSAHRNADGSVNGNAVLHNPAFTNTNGQTYQLQVDVSCLKVVGNVAFFGGTTKRTNDPSVVDAVFFSVQDNGEPGKNRDKISRVFFWDDDPNTTGDPQACQLINPGDFPLETITAGNVLVKP